jgi:glycosyltransferase involved in cell wall biosynthesis
MGSLAMKPTAKASIEAVTLGICGNVLARRLDGWSTHHSLGRIVDELARRLPSIRVFAPQAAPSSAETCDYPLTAHNVMTHPWPPRRHTITALRHPIRLIRDYYHMVRSCRALFLRGSLPLGWSIHWMARWHGVPVVHWIVGHPAAVMRSGPRGYGRVLQAFGLAFAKLEQAMLGWSMRISGAHVLVNGRELARLFRLRRTIPVVSTSILPSDFLVRADTCTRDEIRVLFVGFIRPEKGLEHLIRALRLVSAERRVRLAIVGSWSQFPAEYHRLKALIADLGISDIVTWEGYASFGAPLFAQMDRSDILVLPSLSEGTPRVLVEARARSLPVIATRVGGIPSSVTDGKDGLLTAPGDSAALAAAITQVIKDDDLRRRLIARGRQRVADWTVDRFADLVVRLLNSAEAPSRVWLT